MIANRAATVENKLSAGRPPAIFFCTWTASVIVAGALLQRAVLLYQTGNSPSMLAILSGILHSRALVILSIGILGSIVVVVRFEPQVESLYMRAISLFSRFGRWNLVIFVLWIGLYPLIVSGPLSGKLVPISMVRLIFFWLIALGGAAWLQAAFPARQWTSYLAASTGSILALYTALTYLPSISNSPFSLGWSEGSQLYTASLLFAPRIYGAQASLSVLNPSLDLLNAVPFLLPGLPIWIHRFWRVLLWLGISLATAGSLTRFMPRLDRYDRITFGLLAAALFLQLPVYYNLQLSALLVFLGFRSKNRRTRLAALLVASAWAGLSRVNWFPLPAALAILIYAAETRVQGNLLRYLAWPAAYAVLGTGVALAANALFAILARLPLEYFTTPFSSRLLWDRLWPSELNYLGILPQIVLITLPVGVLLGLHLRRQGRYHWLRRLLPWAVLAVFFAGGLISSVKIGGGNNAHNFDAFIVLLLAWLALVAWGNPIPDGQTAHEAQPLRPWIPMALVSFFVLFFALTGVQITRIISLPPGVLARIQKAIQQADPAGNGEVLFLSERQLLVFGQVRGVKLVPEYEKVFLMEMVMSGNQAYLDQFYQDLQRRRFVLIVSEILNPERLGRSTTFGEENDLWIEKVSIPVLSNYQPILPNPYFHLLVPKG